MRRTQKGLLRGIATLCAVLCVISSSLTAVAQQYKTVVDGALGLQSQKITASTEDTGSTLYYESDFDTAEEVAAYHEALNEVVGAESTVLLKNENQALPLNASESAPVKVTMFGMASYDPQFGSIVSSGYNAWTGVYSEITPDALGFATSFGESNIEVNPTMLQFYEGLSGTYARAMQSGVTGGVTGTASIGEVPISEYEAQSETLEASFAEYNDAAIVVLTRLSGEGWDIPMDASVYTDHDGDCALALNSDERNMIAYAKEHFDKVIVLINTANMMEIKELADDPEIDAIAWIGLPGKRGLLGVGRVLAGQESPSGHLTQTYATSALLAPGAISAGNFTFSNADEILNDYGKTYLVYAENIYVGYRYYETRYEDYVMGVGNANSTVGSTSGEWNYSDEMVYTFGYGLSYTTFEQEIVSGPTFSDGQVTFEVKVTNTGDVAGKSVVQLYMQSPYTEHDKEFGVEKSAVQLLTFNKTDTLQPGESATLTLTAEAKYMASYDEYGYGTYVLEAGEYYFTIGNGAHEAVNNILAKKGYTVANGMTEDGNAELVVSWTNKADDITTYSEGANGETIENQFADADLNQFDTGTTVTYLSRSDWEGTWSEAYTDVKATEDMVATLTAEQYTPGDSDTSSITVGKSGNLKLLHMIGLEYDDPLWEELLDQITYEEYVSIAKSSGAPIATLESIDFIGLPINGIQAAIDYPTGMNTGFRTDTSTIPYGIDTTEADSYLVNYNFDSLCAEVNLGATFNPELAEEQGKVFGNDGLWSEMFASWSVGLNIQRNAFSGRNYEYFSEDPMVGNIMGSLMISKAYEYGHVMIPKHYALNDQENNRQSAATFSREQAIRELYLRSFEGPLSPDEGGGLGIMNSFNRIGVTQAAGSYALNTTVLRDEWGFAGYVITDMALDGIQYGRSSLVAGTDMMLNLFSAYADLNVENFQTDLNLLSAIREATHRTLYVVVNCQGINGMSIDTVVETITNWWEYAIIALDIVFGLCAVAAFVLFLKPVCNKKKEEVRS